MAMVSPSQPRPAVIQSTSSSGIGLCAPPEIPTSAISFTPRSRQNFFEFLYRESGKKFDLSAAPVIYSGVTSSHSGYFSYPRSTPQGSLPIEREDLRRQRGICKVHIF